MKEVKFAKLRARMVELGYTQALLSGKIGISEQSLNAKLAGRVEFTVKEASLITQLLAIDDPAMFFFENDVKHGA